MAMPDLLESIRALIAHEFSPQGRPFVTEALTTRPYDALILDLLGWMWAYEVTDTNYDVAFEYLLRENHRDQSWRLELSMLGRYAALLRTGENNTGVIITAERDDILHPERHMLRLLAKHNVTIVPQQILDVPVDIRLTNAEPGEACIYHALFPDTVSKPWEPWQPRFTDGS